MRKLLLLLVIVSNVRAQQVTDYMQYPLAPVLINPAFCGREGAMTAGLLHREQWTGIDGAPEANTLFLHTPLKNKAFNIGALIEQERFGVFRHNRYSALYAYSARIGGGKLAFGLSAGVENFLNNWNHIVTTTGIDPMFTEGAARVTSPQFATGACYMGRKFTASLSFPQLYSNKSFYNMYIVAVETQQNLGADISVRPILMYRRIPAAPGQLNLSLCTTIRELLTIGASISTNRSAGGLIDVRCNQQMHFSYGYSRLTTDFGTYAGGTHELTLRYVFRYKVRSISAR